MLRLYFHQQKGNKMSATAIAIAEASKEAIYDDDVMDMARQLVDIRNIADEEQMIQMLFHYSARLSAVTANLVTCVLLTESQMSAMLEEIQEIENLGKE